MTSKGAKENLATRLGFKSSNSVSKAEAELERLKQENAHLRRKIDEVTRRHVRSPSSDKSKLLERILSLETLRERNNQQLLVKEQELETLRQQLTARGGEVVASLQAQLEQRKKEAEQRDLLFQNLSQETENLKNQLSTVSARCKSLETQATNGQAPPAELVLLQDQLRDALEKNQQWLTYDQQREAYVQSVLTRLMELEQQAKQQQSKREDAADAAAAASSSEKDALVKSHYEQLLLGAQKDLESQKDQVGKAQQELKMQREQSSNARAELESQKQQVARLQQQLSTQQRKYEDKCDELEEAKMLLQAERLSSRRELCEERKSSSEREEKMRMELEAMGVRLEEKKKRCAELLQEVNQLQRSLLKQSEEQRRTAALEQQILLSTKDFENEKLDRHNMQHQLQKVLKELRKAREQISKLESAKQTNSQFSEPSSYSVEFERLAIGDPCDPSSPSKVSSILDESFLECPKCRTSYPTSRHRELLAHIDFCLA
ncbi:centrosomal protein of 55 kDa [Takifugu flavidus]|uniref:Centrosomal protein of 55 kDa n=1 Tax=Takifugu flavidus TaxID=433684 RepID=A0A5C6PSJ8_9TELE|nr:centrosomal protein of 55 kDa [Takifugu flavidus]TWW81260.1 Centrosomal protein of 55 kDa [Takifugu flavidus]